MALIVSKAGPGSSQDAQATEERRFKARMTEAQIQALALRLNATELIGQIPLSRFWTDARRGANADDVVIERWLRNAWNTEKLLRATSALLETEELSSALQWSFPQAYYSTFAATLAFFHARGFSETSHRGVIEALGKHIADGRYPSAMTFAVSGRADSLKFHGITKPSGYNPIDFDPNIEDTIRLQLCQFLKSTHEMVLDDRRHDMRKQFKTLTGRQRKSLRQSDWDVVATKVGWTSILALLYRKRIKANYGDIETLITDEIDAKQVHGDLVTIVSRLNFVHEALIARAIGLALYTGMVERFQANGRLEVLEHRFHYVTKLFTP